MPWADREKKREWDREIARQRRAEWFAGKICSNCGSADNLELDHEDPDTKISHRVFTWSAGRREAELAKCRPLCARCHRGKSAAEAARGEENGHARLTEEDVRAIRASDLSYRVLAAIYDVHHTTIGMIKRHKKWQHIE